MQALNASTLQDAECAHIKFVNGMGQIAPRPLFYSAKRKAMKSFLFNMLKKSLNIAFFTPCLLAAAQHSAAEPQHAIALYGEPALSSDMESLPYTESNAPQGGRIVYGKRGRFDSLNPFIVKGRAPWAMRTYVFESLMARSWDEPFTLYGLIAQSIDVSDDRMRVTFALNPDARFADGSAITPDDVIFSMRILRDEGRPNFGTYYRRIASVEAVGAREVRFTFKEPERELPLLLGLMPILSRADWEGKDFAETTLTPPMGSGPYAITSVERGERLTLKRRADYWGADLPVNRGVHNFGEVTFTYFRDANALWEAFKAGLVDVRQENDPNRWAQGYDFPAAREGRIERGTLAHGRPTGMYGFTFNTRKALFADRRVREALTHAFDFEWMNTALNRGAYQRITSYFSNSALGFKGAAEGIERELLLPFVAELPEGALETGYALPVSAGDGRNRVNLRKAAALLREAGWTVRDGVLRNADGERFDFEILLSGAKDERIAANFAASLKRLGIEARLRQVESAQYQARLTDYDFDMILRRWGLSLSPGAEQRFYFGSEGITKPGTRNYMGAKNPAIDAMIEKISATDDERIYYAAIRALDRVLTLERYVIPLWFEPVERFAWWKPLKKPDRVPLYGYRPEVWWHGD